MRILCFGSLNIDHVYRVAHIVRPGETISCDSLSDFCGGKGLNQSVALARAGAPVWHAGKVGADGALLLGHLQDAGVHTELVQVDDGVPSGHAIIQVDAGGQNSIVIAGGANTAITEGDVDAFLAPFGAGDLLLVQNETSCVEYAIRQAGEKGMQVALNPSPISDALAKSPALAGVDWFILNEIEGCQITGEQEGRAICAALRRRFPRARVMLTLGKEGCVYYNGAAYHTHGIYDVPPVDTTAAGDTFTGYFLAGATEGLGIEQTLALASKASSIAVGRPGASSSIPARTEVEGARLRPV